MRCVAAPAALTLNDLVDRGDITRAQLLCPSNESGAANYVLVSPPDDPSDPPPPRTVMIYEPKSNHGDEGGNILYTDGFVEFVKAPEYDDLIAGIPAAALPPADPEP